MIGKDPRVLAFDTTSAACSVALWADRGVAGAARRDMEKGHAEALMPMIVELMAQRGWTYDSLDGIAVSVGPGAFTGIRVGLAAARGLGLAAALPVVGVTSLEAMAVGAREHTVDGAVLCLLDTKRRDFYGQRFGAGLAPIDAPAIIDPKDLPSLLLERDVIVATDRADLVRSALAKTKAAIRLAQGVDGPDAVHVAALGASRLTDHRRDWAALPPPEPLYLRAPAAKVPKAGGRLRP